MQDLFSPKVFVDGLRSTVENTAMTLRKWLAVAGAVFLLAGLITAFVSNHYTVQIQGERRMGAIVFGPVEGTPEWQETERRLKWADRFFYVGLTLTAIGIILQTVGAILPVGSQVPSSDLAALESTGKAGEAHVKELPSNVPFPNDEGAGRALEKAVEEPEKKEGT